MFGDRPAVVVKRGEGYKLKEMKDLQWRKVGESNL